MKRMLRAPIALLVLGVTAFAAEVRPQAGLSEGIQRGGQTYFFRKKVGLTPS